VRRHIEQQGADPGTDRNRDEDRMERVTIRTGNGRRRLLRLKHAGGDGALDVGAEAEVLRALDALITGRTVIVIPHRLRALGNVDQIIVLGGRRVVE